MNIWKSCWQCVRNFWISLPIRLKTPVSVIRSTLSMFEAGDMDKLSREERTKFFHNMSIKAAKLNTIISDILRASEMDSDEFKIDYSLAQPMQMEDIINTVYKQTKEMAQGRGLRLELRLPQKKTAPFLSENQFFEQAVFNLVDNAIKYTERGSVRISLDQVKHNLILTVEDSGIGIPQAEQKKLFDKFPALPMPSTCIRTARAWDCSSSKRSSKRTRAAKSDLSARKTKARNSPLPCRPPRNSNC